MKLSYKILWYDDQFEHINADIRKLERYIRSHGFIPEIDKKTGISENDIDELADRLFSYNPYDIIIFDYDLGSKSEDGLSIAAKLRSRIFTDLIFYSGKVPAELRQMLCDRHIDGVFVIGRPEFYDEIEPIVEDHIKRMSDINNIRGVSMSAVSSIERIMRDSMINHLGNKEHGELLLYIKEKLIGKLDDDKKNIENITDIKVIVDDPMKTSFQIVRLAYKRCLDGDSKCDLLKDGTAIHKVQMERNKLAHQKDEYTKDGKMVLHGVDGKTKEYNFEEFKRLRNELLDAMESVNKL